MFWPLMPAVGAKSFLWFPDTVSPVTPEVSTSPATILAMGALARMPRCWPAAIKFPFATAATTWGWNRSTPGSSADQVWVRCFPSTYLLADFHRPTRFEFPQAVRSREWTLCSGTRILGSINLRASESELLVPNPSEISDVASRRMVSRMWRRRRQTSTRTSYHSADVIHRHHVLASRDF